MSDAPSTNVAEIDLPIDEVFDLLCDAAHYPEWLVGAQHIRSVDTNWPRPGASFLHRIGLGPLTVPGSTTVRAAERPHRLTLAAGMGPLGEATVDFELTSDGDGRTFVTMEEKPARGPMRLGWKVATPALRMLLWGRNEASMRTFADLATNGRSGRSA